jgi:hypothetical protein
VVLETFVDVPLTWAQRQVFSPDSADKNDVTGISAIGAGLKYLFKQQDRQWPDIIGSFSFTAPTGEKPNPKNLNDVPLGSGHWHISTGLTLVKSYNPAGLFGGLGYTHTFKETLNDIEVAPGNIDFQIIIFKE